MNDTYIYTLRLLPEYSHRSHWSEETRQIVSLHFNYLKKLKNQGQVILAGKTDYEIDHQDNFGLVVFHAKTKKSAQQLMENDPAVQNTIMTAKLHPFSLALGDITKK